MSRRYESIRELLRVDRRGFLKAGSLAGAGLLLGTPGVWASDKESGKEERAQTNIDEVKDIPRTPHSLPGPYPGRVVRATRGGAMTEKGPDPKAVHEMFQAGIEKLTGKPLGESFGLFFSKEDVIGIKVNPVGPGLISTNPAVVDEIVAWLEMGGVPRENIVIWDRFDYMLRDAGFTTERYPGIGLEGLQTMDESAFSGESEDDSRWLDKEGNHVSARNFDRQVYYWADIEAPQDKGYLNQHVFNGKESYFGTLLTQKLTKMINVPVFKNTGNGISIATKNIGYGAICNTGRLHRPLFFDVCTEVHAFPVIRDKLVLNVIDGLRGQYDGGPMPAADFTYDYNTLFFATDPFALDRTCHDILVNKRKSVGVEVNEHPMFTDYLHYGEKLGLGIGDPEKIELVSA